MTNVVLELTPLVLAFIAVFCAGTRHNRIRRLRDKFINGLSIVCASLLIIAQSSWYTTAVVMNKLEDTFYANLIWTVFNSLVMIMIIILSLPRKSNKDHG